MNSEIDNQAPKFRSFGYYEFLPFSWTWLFNTIIWYLACAGIVYCQGAFPSLDTKSTSYQNFFKRQLLNTTYFPFGQLVLYLVMVIVGWAYVNIIVRNRVDPFTSGNKEYQSFLQMLSVTPFIFFTSAVFVLRQPYGMVGVCNQQNPQYLQGHSIFRQSISCNIFTDEMVFDYNFYLWTSALFIGLNMQVLKKGPFRLFKLSSAKMKYWPPLFWAALVILIFGFTLVLYFIFEGFYKAGVLVYYLIWLIVCPLIIVGITWRAKQKGYEFHLHHYAVAFIAMTFCADQSATATVFHGFLQGMMIEGGSNYGFDPIWYKPEDIGYTVDMHKVYLI